MIKAVLVLGIIGLTFFTFNWNKNSIGSKPEDVETIISPTIAQNPIVLGDSVSNSNNPEDWDSYENTDLGIKIKYPKDQGLKVEQEDSLRISNESILIEISKEVLFEKDTVNTVAEKNINLKMEKLKDSFKLIDSISPIAIGQITGVTFSTEEETLENTYYYVPLGKSFIAIKDSTKKDYLTISDGIIYSLEILPE